MNKKDLVHKPNRTTMITNNEITAIQKKAYNVILHQAQKQVRLNPNQILFYYSISDLKDMAGIHATNNKELKQSIDKLRFIGVETVHENGDWLVFNLIAQAEKKGDGLEIQLPEAIRQALIINDYYTTLDLMIMKNLEGKYAIILYEMAMRYNKIQIPELTIEEFRELTGTTSIKSYDGFGVNRQKVIEPAINEINEKTDIKLKYETIKIGRKVTSIKFKILKNKQPDFDEATEPEQSKNQESISSEEKNILVELCREQNEEIKNFITESIEKYDFELIESNIKYTNKYAKDNYFVYLKKAIQNDYAKTAREKKTKQQTQKLMKEQQLETFEKEKAEFENYFNEYCEIEYSELEDFELKKYKKEFKQNEEIYTRANLDLKKYIIGNLKNSLLEMIQENCDFENFKEYKQFLEFKKEQ